jgi:hypothetical protein
MPLLQAFFLALSVVLAADADDQPACRERCDAAWSADRAACEDLPSPNAADECRDDADERHQDCIDRCND